MTRAPLTSASLATMKSNAERIAVMTCYDASFCRVLDGAGVDVLLVGDSLGNVVQGHASTVPVTLEQMVYHTACVSRVAERVLVVADMPFLSYATPERAIDAASKLMGEGGAAMVKVEGGASVVKTVRLLCDHGVAVCAHLGLLPQSVHRLGGYSVQGREHAAAEAMRRDALALQDAGASMLVLECVPAALAGEIRRELTIPVIGIGAGVDCDGQVLVLYDALGLNPGKAPSFVRNFLADGGDIAEAMRRYVAAVRDGSFPGSEHTLA